MCDRFTVVLGRHLNVLLFCAMGCATPHHIADLPQDVPDSGVGEEGVKSDMPKQGDEQLAQSFEPEKEAPKETPKPVGEAKPAAGAEEEANARRTFDEQLKVAQKAIASGKAEEGRDAVKLLSDAAESLFPADVQRAAELRFQLERSGDDPAAAMKAGFDWLLTCGPDRVDGCRAKVLASLTALTKKKDAPPGLKEKLRNFNDADACLKKLEQTRKPTVCETANGVYHHVNDKLMSARLLLARAEAVVGDPKKKDEAVALLGRVDAECGELRCVSIRKRALAERRRLALRDQDLDEAARAVLLEVKLSSLLLPRAQRTYARTVDADRICTQLDAKSGPGSCRKLEKRINGEYSFKDFSAGKVLPGLGQDKVKEVNDHYGCLLEECLAAQAERLRPPDSETYEVRWMVLNDGRVGEVHLKRKEDDESALGDCLRQQFAVWRYPKYQGEFQHVEQRFIVSARSHR